MSGRPAGAQCAAVLIAGWLPISVEQSISEGHTDIVLACGVLLWLSCAESGHRLAANLALAGSILVKYVSAPLVMLAIPRNRADQRRWWIDALVPIGLMTLAFSVFVRDRHFFDPLWSTREWTAYEPGQVLWSLRSVLGWQVATVGAIAIRLGFLALAVYAVTRHYQCDETGPGRYAALSILIAVLFSSGWRLYPWYLSWLIGLAALSLETRLARWVVGLALAFPFAWLWLGTIRPLLPRLHHDVPAVAAMYVFAMVWIWLTRKKGRTKMTPEV